MADFLAEDNVKKVIEGEAEEGVQRVLFWSFRCRKPNRKAIAEP